MTRRRRGPAGLFLLALLTGGAGADAVLEGRTLRFEDGPRLVSSRTYPPELGELTGPVTLGESTYLGVGPVVYALTERGQVQARYDLPGEVTGLDASGSVAGPTSSMREGPGHDPTRGQR